MVLIPESGANARLEMASTRQVEKLRKENAQMFTMFTTMEVEGGVGIIDLPMMWNFLNDISDVSPNEKQSLPMVYLIFD
ncbi:hypothetical protein L195_g059234 [Trifolium pratense]|uniref:Uncharacterized protein n=1 Tax=Trifolium pratense TaxID=57577 RepID=A0A2K3JWU7_TRIPR|nr:hypothetical protein L195_g059234 [Trifolium pratense]